MTLDTSMVYTVGTALRQARDNDKVVDILVAGQWLRGAVVMCDGHVVLDNGDDHAVARVEAVSAVRVLSAVPPGTGSDDWAPIVKPTPLSRRLVANL
jgi:ABC-type branched-subunit amino acid transport system ATPase component